MNKVFPDPASAPSPAVSAPRPPRRTLSPTARVWRRIEHWIILIHRWIGILTCLACVVWCLSGIVLIYIVQPKVMDAEYRASLNPIAWSQVRTDPTAALKASGVKTFPQRMRLEMSGGRPVYFFTDWNGAVSAVTADDGALIKQIAPARAVAIGRGFAHSERPTYLRLVDKDRWVFGANYDKTRPYHLVALHDDLDRYIYVSAKTGAVVIDTSSHDRFWTWLARVPHLVEIPWMREHAVAWRNLMLWSTGLATLVLISGMWLGITRLSLVKRYSEGRVSPFHGWMLWHHLLGIVGGLTLFTWVGTAWIYMHPGQYLESTAIPKTALQAYTGHKGADFPLSAAKTGAIAPVGALYAGFDWLAGKPIVFFGLRDGKIDTFDGATGAAAPLSDARLTEAARLLVPGAPVVYSERRTTPDRYWHSFKGDVRKVPIFRVVFGDRNQTWVHLDPDTGDVVQTRQDSDRTYFLFFNEIHKFDFYSVRGLAHEVLVWVLMLMATGISMTGAVVGWKHLSRPSRPGRKPSPSP
jgi:hypothetical protein